MWFPVLKSGPEAPGGSAELPQGSRGSGWLEPGSHPSDLIRFFGFLSRKKTFGIQGLSLRINLQISGKRALSEKVGDLPSLL